jgi:mono/diheme cytochrome c family protein
MAMKRRWAVALGAVVVGLMAWAAQAPPPGGGEQRRLIDSLEGQALYHEYCAVCHGERGKGDGPMARALKSPPADLTHIAMRNGGAFPLKKVERIISGDSPVEPGHGTREMPLWGPIFSQISWDLDLGNIRVANLAKYIESLQK